MRELHISHPNFLECEHNIRTRKSAVTKNNFENGTSSERWRNVMISRAVVLFYFYFFRFLSGYTGVWTFKNASQNVSTKTIRMNMRTHKMWGVFHVTERHDRDNDHLLLKRKRIMRVLPFEGLFLTDDQTKNFPDVPIQGVCWRSIERHKDKTISFRTLTPNCSLQTSTQHTNESHCLLYFTTILCSNVNSIEYWFDI